MDILKKYKINFKDYAYHGRWAGPPLAWSIWMDWAHGPDKRIKGIRERGSKDFFVDGYNFLEKNGIFGAVKKKLFQELACKPYKSKTAQQIFRLAENIEGKVFELTKITRKKSSSNENFKKLLLLYVRAVFPHQLAIGIGDEAEEIWRESGFNDESLLLIEPFRKPLSTLDSEKLRQLRKEFGKFGFGENTSFVNIKKNNPGLASKILEYQQETEYIGTHNFWGDPRTIGKLMEEINSLVIPPKKAKRRGARKPLSLKQKNIVDIISKASYWRFQLPMLMARVSYLLKPALAEIGRKYNLSSEHIIYATHREILDEINRKKKLNLKEILNRMRGYAMLHVNREDFITIAGKDAEKLRKFVVAFQEKNVGKDIRIIKGQTASKGFISAKVIIAITPDDARSIKKGNILVAPETTPDFLPAMSKAAAFVTDRGGLTSHAAIVAREMGKPCVIGTKIATQVLKDGDLVEVDANKGIVRILK